MKDPKVIDPPGFDLAEAWGKMQQFDDPGCCSCPVCDEYYWTFGRVIECDCGFQFPTNWWSEYSSGCGAGRRVAAGGTTDGYIELKKKKNPYYRHGFDNPVEDAFEHKDLVDWQAVCEGTPMENYFPAPRGTCDRCGQMKEDSRKNSSKLCIKCTTETECEYRCSMMEKQCRAGIIFDELRKKLPSPISHSLPCYYIGGTTRIDCIRFEPVTAAECEESDQATERAIARIMTAGPIIGKIKEEHKGSDWQGTEECPICAGILHLSHAAYNGHVHGRCETENCLNWME